MGYDSGKIYKLIHKDGRFYIGSTCDYPSVRFYKHKRNGLVKEFHNDWDNVKMEVIEKYPCKTREELQTREQYFLDLLKNDNCLNKIRAKRRPRHEEHKANYQAIKGTDRDYYAKHREANREKNKEYSKMYYEKNKDRILQKAREKYASPE